MDRSPRVQSSRPMGPLAMKTAPSLILEEPSYSLRDSLPPADSAALTPPVLPLWKRNGQNGLWIGGHGNRHLPKAQEGFLQMSFGV